VCLQPEVPLLSLARLVHFRIALPSPVLRRRGRMNNGAGAGSVRINPNPGGLFGGG
jgi:hypothetical protein